MRFFSDSFICKFCMGLEGHSFWGLQPTSRTAVSPPPKQVRHGNNKCERSTLLKRPKLNCIDFFTKPQIAYLIQALECLLFDELRRRHLAAQPSCESLGLSCEEKGWGQNPGHVTSSEPSSRATPLRKDLKVLGPAEWSHPCPKRQRCPAFLLKLRRENMGKPRSF